MRYTAQFTNYIDLGELGEHLADVEASCYRPARVAEDDYPEVEITKCVITLAGVQVDIASILSDNLIDRLKFEASEWAAEASACAAEERADALREERLLRMEDC